MEGNMQGIRRFSQNLYFEHPMWLTNKEGNIKSNINVVSEIKIKNCIIL
jgi:hypothetical protein